MGWFERQAKRLLQGSPAAIIDARPEFGVPFLFQSLSSTSQSFIWIRIADSDDSVAIGSKISLALERATGAVLFGTGMADTYALNYLQGLSSDLGPICLLAEDCHLNARFVEAALLASRRSRGRLRVALAGYGDGAAWRGLVDAYGGNLVDESFLRLVPTEWASLVEASAVPRGTLSIPTPDDYSYEAAIQTVAEAEQRPATSRPAPVYGAEPSDVARLGVEPSQGGNELNQSELGQFAQRVKHAPARAIEMLTKVGDTFFAQGRVLDLLTHTEALLAFDPDSAECLYWWYQASIAIGEQARAEERIAGRVRADPSGAPALTASYASSARPPDAMQLARRAVRESRTPETTAALGFLKILDGSIEGGVADLKSAHSGYLASAQRHRAIQVGNSIGSAYVNLGDFEAAALWARRGLEEIRRYDIREELIRLSTTNLLAYSLLLLGDVERGLEVLERVKLPEVGDLPPTLEGLVTTFGDYAVATGRPDDALQQYGRVYDELSSRLPGYTARHYLRGLLSAGECSRARAVVAVAEEHVMHTDVSEASSVAVCRMILGAQEGPVAASTTQQLRSRPPNAVDAVTRLEITLHAAVSWLRAGDGEKAAAELLQEREALKGLGRSGWRLLSPPGSDIDALQRLAGIAEIAVPRLEVLGTSSFERAGLKERLGGRYAELLAVLAMNPDGLTGEKLLLELYGDSGSQGTLKSVVSRTRKFVKIASGPYRLGEPLLVDAVDVESHLASGNLSQALELYQGPLLPESEAPGIVRERERIDEALRQAVLMSDQAELMLRLARKSRDDLELWERAMELMPKDDPAYPLIRAQVRRIRGEWGL